MSDTGPIGLLVLGLGNPLFADDGAGVLAVSRLRERYRAPHDVEVLDGGTLGLALLSYVQRARRAILVDAVRTGDVPGTLVRLRGDDVTRATAYKLSPHQVGVADLLDGATFLGAGPRGAADLVLLGIVPDRLELAFGLSPTVEAELDGIVRTVVDEAANMGFHFERGTSDAPGTDRGGDPDVARILGV